MSDGFLSCTLNGGDGPSVPQEAPEKTVKKRGPYRVRGITRARREAEKARADARRDRLKRAAELVVGGMGLMAAAREMGVSKGGLRSALIAAGHYEFNRRRRGRLPESAISESTKYNRQYQEKYPERRAAHKAVERAKKTGVISRQNCEDCGSEKAEAHHPDYSHPLLVEWLCHRCHMTRHRRSAA